MIYNVANLIQVINIDTLYAQYRMCSAMLRNHHNHKSQPVEEGRETITRGSSTGSSTQKRKRKGKSGNNCGSYLSLRLRALLVCLDWNSFPFRLTCSVVCEISAGHHWGGEGPRGIFEVFAY